MDKGNMCYLHAVYGSECLICKNESLRKEIERLKARKELKDHIDNDGEYSEKLLQIVRDFAVACKQCGDEMPFSDAETIHGSCFENITERMMEAENSVDDLGIGLEAKDKQIEELEEQMMDKSVESGICEICIEKSVLKTDEYREKLQSAEAMLRKYGNHWNTCINGKRMNDLKIHGGCSCGYEKALRY